LHRCNLSAADSGLGGRRFIFLEHLANRTNRSDAMRNYHEWKSEPNNIGMFSIRDSERAGFKTLVLAKNPPTDEHIEIDHVSVFMLAQLQQELNRLLGQPGQHRPITKSPASTGLGAAPTPLQAEVLELLAKAPAPPNEQLPPGAAESDLAGCEQRIGVSIPPELRAWLSTCNGPCVCDGVFGVNPGRKHLDIERVIALSEDWRKKGWIPVSGDGCGNYYLVATQGEFGEGEPVFFIDTMGSTSEPAYLVASDIWHFLRFLLKRALRQSRWPFDREEVSTADPDILTFHGVPLPWDA
jgi:cell wall assembly regulator SMI1